MRVMDYIYHEFLFIENGEGVGNEVEEVRGGRGSDLPGVCAATRLAYANHAPNVT